MRRPRDLPKNRRTRRWADSIKLFLGDMQMNIFSLLGLKDGVFDRNPLAAAFSMFDIRPPKDGFYRRFSGKSKTFKKNKRKGL
jgi:hypothetical protein